MRATLRNFVVVAAVAATLVACGSSDSRDRNVELAVACNAGGPCTVGEPGPAGGLVVVGGNNADADMWEAAPLNGFGAFDEAGLAVADLNFGGFTDWVLPTADVLDEMWASADQFACGEASDCVTAYAPGMYWSSDGNEVDGVNVKSFVDGANNVDPPTSTNYYRPVRKFRMAEVVPAAVTTVGQATSTTVAEETTTSVEETTTSLAGETLVDETTTTSDITDETTTIAPSTTESVATPTTATPTTVPPTTTGVIKPASCAEGGKCKVGDTGPAGGLILLDDFDLGAPPTLIEVAPTTWFGPGIKAKAYVDNLNYGGFDDWQMPSLTQLQTMRRERARFVCATGTRCTNGFVNSTYWAAETAEPSHTLSFAGVGVPQPAAPGTSHFVRPVRLVGIAGAGGVVVTIAPLAEA